MVEITVIIILFSITVLLSWVTTVRFDRILSPFFFELAEEDRALPTFPSARGEFFDEKRFLQGNSECHGMEPK